MRCPGIGDGQTLGLGGRVEGGRVASSTVDSFTQMASKQGGNSGLPWKTARCDHNLPRGRWGGGFGG